MLFSQWMVVTEGFGFTGLFFYKFSYNGEDSTPTNKPKDNNLHSIMIASN